MDKINVFIDSNIFIKERYSISDNSRLGLLKKHVNEGKVSIFSNIVIFNEIVKHAKKDFTDLFRDLEYSKKRVRKGIPKGLIEDTVIEDLVSANNPELLADILIQKVISFFSDAKVEMFDNKNTDVDKLIVDYFNSNPPFEIKTDKKHEFPDAIVIQSIRNRRAAITPLIVITEDDGFKKALSGDGDIEVLDNLKVLLDRINQNDRLYESIKNSLMLTTQHPKFRSELLSMISFDVIGIDGYDCDRDNICEGYEFDQTDVQDGQILDINLVSINDIDQNNINATLSCKFHFLIWASFTDFENAIYDNEEKTYYNVREIELEETHEIETDIDVTLSISRIGEEISFDFKELDYHIELNQYSRLERDFLNKDDHSILDFINYEDL